MPNRYLRDSILDSDRVNSLSFDAEVFYRRLMSVVDDFGRFDGRVSILKGRMYALKPSVRDTDITRWIAACVKAGLIAVYHHDAKPYILFHRLGETRAKHSKFPAPPVDTCEHMHADENICLQTQTHENTCEHMFQILSTSNTSTTTNTSTKNPPTPHRDEQTGLEDSTNGESESHSKEVETKPKARKPPKSAPGREIDDLPWDRAVCPLPHQNEEFSKAWDEWVSMRASTKKPVTNRIARLTMEKIRKAGLTLAEATEAVFESAANGWQGIVIERVLKKRTGIGQSPKFQPRRDQEIDRLAENAAIVREAEESLKRNQHGGQQTVSHGSAGYQPVAIGPG